MSNLIAFIVGIFASFVASKVFQIYNNSNKPNIIISNDLIKKTTKENKEIVTLKLLNKTKQDLCNVEVRLDGIKNMKKKIFYLINMFLIL
jgi:hypothetical protein